MTTIIGAATDATLLGGLIDSNQLVRSQDLNPAISESVNEWLSYLQNKFPELSRILDISSINSRLHYLMDSGQIGANEFSEDGRGEEYTNSIEIYPLARQEGTIDLLKLTHPQRELRFSKSYFVADLLAGDGYINKIANSFLPEEQKPTLINSDLSLYMIKRCLKQGLIGMLQSADDLFWFLPESIDAVIFAYGTHHIPKEQRPQAAREAARILKEGGRWVMHDFEEGSSMAIWFAEVVSNYSKTRHDYPHFTQQEMLSLAQYADLEDVHLDYIPDPFVVQASTESAALSLLAKYVINMYGLIYLNGDIEKTVQLLYKYFEVRVCKIQSFIYEARIVRNALVCHGTKP
jgi:ubiquinone/menaquinone biosynthesis C-methylase UbiE